MTWILLSSKYDGKCRECNDSIEKGDSIYWNTTTKKVLHEQCYFSLFSSTNEKKLEEITDDYEPDWDFSRHSTVLRSSLAYDLKDKTPSNPHIYRHGDLCIREVTEFPKHLTKLDTKVLAEGEVTGHTHTIEGNAQIFENLNKDLDNKFLEVFDEVKLVHQEHKQINIKPGKYVVIIEQEHNPFKNENVEVLD